MTNPIIVAKRNNIICQLLPKMANRHGLITGATGTGKTVTLQALAEGFSKIGVPVFATDIKGDLSGISQAGNLSEKMANILATRNISMPPLNACPTVFWDVFGEQGTPVRATVSDMGSLLIGRLLNLNNTQAGILDIVFKIADDEKMLLIDLKDLRRMLQYVADKASPYNTDYGNISKVSVSTIQRNLLQIQSQGGDIFFAEPMLDINDMFTVDSQNRGTINLMAADKLMQSPRLYSTFLLWLLTQLFEKLPEIGDPEKPKMVFFFDEAHLLFNDAPAALLERIELVVRLIRSKGVGIYFVTQNPSDIPDTVLGQLGNRIQHALRAFTPRDQKAVRVCAQTMRPKAGLNIEKAITELAVGEALVSLLDEHGSPNETEQVFIIPPGSQLGPITEQQRKEIINNCSLNARYAQSIDRISAYEILEQKMQQPPTDTNKNTDKSTDFGQYAKEILIGKTGPRGGKRDGIVQSLIKSNLRRFINQIIRSFFGGRRR